MLAPSGARLVVTAFAVPILILLVLYLFGGPEQLWRGRAVRADLLLLVYPVGLLLMGAIGVTLLPRATKPWTALTAGILAVAPLCFGIGLTADRGYADWTWLHTGISAFCSILFGWALASGFTGRKRSRGRRSHTRAG